MLAAPILAAGDRRDPRGRRRLLVGEGGLAAGVAAAAKRAEKVLDLLWPHGLPLIVTFKAIELQPVAVE